MGFRLFLNEVLSLNAQEFIARRTRLRFAVILNEVLSLNAQECRSARCQRMDRPPQ